MVGGRWWSSSERLSANGTYLALPFIDFAHYALFPDYALNYTAYLSIISLYKITLSKTKNSL